MITRHRRLAALAAAIGLAALFLPALAGIAFGHHATTAATLKCDGSVTWTVTNWTNNNAGGQATNTHIMVRYSTTSASGPWTAAAGPLTITATNYSTPLTGTFSVGTSTTVYVQSYATGTWADGANDSGPWPATATTPNNCASKTTTAIHDANHNVALSVPLGTTVHDSATVTFNAGDAAIVPTGNVVFKWFTNGSCSGNAAATSGNFALVSGSVDGTSFTQTPAAPGSYSFLAVYSGNSRFLTSTATCEPLTVTKIDSSTVTTIRNALGQTILSAPIGSTVYDFATVTGSGPAPTGNVTFTYYPNTTCAPTGTGAGTKTIASGTAGPSDPQIVGVNGGSFKATYNGDINYNPSTGVCEPLQPKKLDSTTVTTIHLVTGAPVVSAPIGSQVFDSVTVSGSGPTPTGTVTFTYYPNTTCSPTGTGAGSPTLSGGSATSTPQTVGVNGGSFKAVYGGDATYNGSTGDCEPLQPVKLDSGTKTDIHDVNHVVITSALIGSTVHDSATVTGTVAGGVPAGYVDFTVFPTSTCIGVAGTPAGHVLLDASGVADPSSTAVVTSAGLAFQAHYLGSATYAESTGLCEPLTAIKLASSTKTDIHDANHVAITSALIGTSVHDSATVTGTPGYAPGGTVTFTLYAGMACSGDGTPAGIVNVNAVGIADPSTSTIVAAGGLSYRAVYSGDNNYFGSTGDCEQLTALKLDSSTKTDIHDANHVAILSAPIGTTVHDSATVTGAPGVPPTGTVDFTVYSGTTCSGNGTFAGSIALDAFGVADPSATTVVGPGGLSYSSVYSGDRNYNGSIGACEQLTAIKLDSGIKTDIHDANHAIITQALIGTTVHDSATVTGTPAGGVPTGTVTFTAYDNVACSGEGSFAGTVPLVSGVADPSDDQVVAAGGLSFIAHYNGSPTYNESTGTCERLKALQIPSSTTTTIHGPDPLHIAITSAPIGSSVHDSAVVTGAPGIPPTGTVDFTLYQGMQCSGDSVSAGSVALDASGVADPSDSATVPVGGLSYSASYSGDTNYQPSKGDCEPLDAKKLLSTTTTDLHDANDQIITSAPIGSTVHDTATVTGDPSGPVPTGTVTFIVYQGVTDCSTEGAPAGSAPLVGGFADGSTPQVVAAGGLSFSTHYSGDDTYAPSDGACEPLPATQLDSSTATEIHDATHTVVTNVLVGTAVHDKAIFTVSGPTPGGTVTFNWYTNSSCDGTPTASSGPIAVTGTSVDADGFVQTPAVAGGYGFQAVYSGDDNYAPSTGACEPLTAHNPNPTPTPTNPPTLPPTHVPTEPPFPSFPTEPPTATPAPTATPTEVPTLTPPPTPTPSGEVAGVTAKPHITPPPTTTSGSGSGSGGFGLAAVLFLLVAAAGVFLLATPKRRPTRR
jgi:hypothetical protein